jgi:uncharacterized protein (TIGR02466 family)
MELTPIFSVGVGKAKATNLLGVARQLFADNQSAIIAGGNGLSTTLQRYNSTQDCAILNNQSAVAKIKESIKQNASLFYAGIGFDVDQLEFEVVNLWLNEMDGGGIHPPHSHYGFQLSGCFYVDVPQGSNLIKFYTPLQKREHGDNPEKEYNQYNGKFYGNYVEEGDMFFWESLLQHEVPPLEFRGIRRSIAYDLSISKKLNTPIESKYKMNLQDYVAVYNINDALLCKQVIEMMDEEKWGKHAYSDPITGEHTTYDDDLDISYQNDVVANKLQDFFEQCAREYLTTVTPASFPLQEITRIRFNRYKVGANMKMHHDHIHTIFDGERKGVPILSFLMLLNDNFEGGDFLMFDGKKLKLSAGDVIVFPSNFMYPHAVTTVTKGTRYSCVSWGY